MWSLDSLDKHCAHTLCTYIDLWLLLIVYNELVGKWGGYSLLRMYHLVFSKRLIHVQGNVKEGSGYRVNRLVAWSVQDPAKAVGGRISGGGQTVAGGQRAHEAGLKGVMTCS